ATAGQNNFRVRVVIKDGGEVVRNSAVGMKRLEVFITACECNIPTNFWKSPQHTQVPNTCWLPIDVHIPYASTARSHNLPFLAVFADHHLTRHASGLLSKEERWLTEESKGYVTRHGDTAQKGAKFVILRL